MEITMTKEELEDAKKFKELAVKWEKDSSSRELHMKCVPEFVYYVEEIAAKSEILEAMDNIDKAITKLLEVYGIKEDE